jgi:transcriptional regulator GlxA family with amidase domain
MKKVFIIVPEGDYILSSVVGTFKVFTAANTYQSFANRPLAYTISLVGNKPRSVLYNGLFVVNPDTMLADAGQADLIVIPAISASSVSLNTPFIPWIRKQYEGGAEVASLCTGAFLLACTGLLEGKQCATHWKAANAFRTQFPNVKLAPEKIIIDEDGIYSSGGAYSFLNLLLYLVEKHLGREVAIYLSKLLEVELQRDTQSPFIIFEGQKVHEDEPIKRAQTFIEDNVGSKISVEQLAQLFAISRRNFERRFRKATSNSPAEYQQRVKIEAAKKAFEATNDNVNEVMYAVGYTDAKAFRTIFKKNTGLSPLEYRRKYNRIRVVSTAG